MITRLAHILLGILTTQASTIQNGWAIVLSLTLLFIVYEINEQKYIPADSAYEEISEYIIGICIGTVILILQNE